MGSLGGSSFDLALTEFTRRWELGERVRAEDFFERLSQDRTSDFVELIYREYCMAESAGLAPNMLEFLDRFPTHRESLGRLFAVHDALGSSQLRLWSEPVSMPEVGNAIGPYFLLHELGRGGFARVFLAEQSDLDDRLVVLKVSSRKSLEHRLLARSSHPHIVEVLWHGEVEDVPLQIICMPFLGGTTLSALLADQRKRGERPSSGLGLLADLDRVSVAGYPAAGSSRPARRLIEGLSYPKATGWFVARLAEALDFAYSRNVLHGDVKPSNILITADGSPMLLDFNLAVGWQSSSPVPSADDAPGDPGGTLAYMAPERLQAVAEPGSVVQPSPAARHRADIYSLGVVLFEALTGRASEIPGGKPLSFQELASAYVSSRQQGGEVMIRSARSSLPSGLRPILARCLAPDPVDRYKRASELADDLDCWREDRPLIYAQDRWRRFALARWVRRQRQTLMAAVVVTSVVAVGGLFAWRLAEANAVRKNEAMWRYSQILDSEDSDAFLVRRQHSSVINLRGEPAEIAWRHLERYGVLQSKDWRVRDNVRSLPDSERAELEIWLLEQALRYAHALAARPDAEASWRRALLCLENSSSQTLHGPIEDQARELRRLLRQPDPTRPQPAEPDPRRLWMDDYLCGVEAELRGDAGVALDHFLRVLEDQPNSFWASYRAAAAEARLGDFRSAAEHLRECVAQHPENAVLRRQYAGCLVSRGAYLKAEREYEKAKSLDPEQPETYLSRAFLHVRMNQTRSYLNDMLSYESLKGLLPRSSAHPFSLALPGPSSKSEVGETASSAADWLDPELTVTRGQLAQELLFGQQNEPALDQFEHVLAADPNNIRAHWGRAELLKRLNRKNEAVREYTLVVEHPQVESWIRSYPGAIYAFVHTATDLIDHHQSTEALEIAKRGVTFAERHKRYQPELHLILARAYAHASKDDPGLTRLALNELKKADQYHFKKFDDWLASDPVFQPYRIEFVRPQTLNR